MKLVIGVFSLAVTIAVVASFPGTVEAVNPDEALLRLFPLDTEGVGFVDVAQLRDNSLINELVIDRVLRDKPRAIDEFEEQTGLDLESDIQQVMVGRTGEKEFLIAARANYEDFRVEQYFKDKGVDFDTYAGRTMYLLDGDDDGAVSFVDGLVLVGNRNSIQEALDRLNAPSTTAMASQDLLASINSIDEGSQVWAVGAFEDFLLPDGIAPAMTTDLFDALEDGTYQMRIDSIVTARAIGDFTTPEVAQRTTDLLRGLVALGKMQAYERQEFIELLDGVQIETVDTAVHIDFSADGELLRRIHEADDQQR